MGFVLRTISHRILFQGVNFIFRTPISDFWFHWEGGPASDRTPVRPERVFALPPSNIRSYPWGVGGGEGVWLVLFAFTNCLQIYLVNSCGSIVPICTQSIVYIHCVYICTHCNNIHNTKHTVLQY